MQCLPFSRHPPGAIAMISGDLTRYAASMHSLCGLVAPAGSVLAWHMGCLISRSLNDAFSVVMDNPTLQWVWVMGDDHTFEPDILLKLLDRDKDIVLPLCLNRAPPIDPTIVETQHMRMKYLEEIPLEGLYKLQENETCGDAGLLIRRNALEKLGPPWYEQRRSGAFTPDDQEFVEKIKEAGFEIFVDMDVCLGHIAAVEFKPVRKNGHWEVRMTGGGKRHIADLGVMSRAGRAVWELHDKMAREKRERGVAQNVQ